VYGVASPELAGACERRRIALHSFAWRSVMSNIGLKENAAYLVRPDGYVALADPEGSGTELERYCEAQGIGARPAAAHAAVL